MIEMVKKGEVYKCIACKNIVTVVEGDIGTLFCCGHDMQLLDGKTSEQEGKEKHVPVIERDGNKVTVKVGSVEHPMTDEHYIELIQLYDGDRVIAEKFLYPGEKPEAFFLVGEVKDLKAKELCNIHGLWTS